MIKFSQKWVDKAYELGKVDCFAPVLDYVPNVKEFKGITRENYAQLFKDHPEEAQELMLQFMDTYFKQVSLYNFRPGDIFLLKPPNAKEFLAVCTGNAHAIVVDPKYGVLNVPVDDYEIKRVYRCQEQQ